MRPSTPEYRPAMFGNATSVPAAWGEMPQLSNIQLSTANCQPSDLYSAGGN
jgi:hypothetical protein